MKTFSLSILYVLSSIGLWSILTQVDITANDWKDLIQLPMIAGLIWLVLGLEDRRAKSAQVREEAHNKTIDSLLGVIIELATFNTPSRISSDQIRSIESYLKSQSKQRGE